MHPRQLIIFDLDDTLVDTSQVYWQARTCFIQLLVAEEFDPETVLEEFEKTDEYYRREMKFSPERYGTSMLATYSNLVSQINRTPSSETISRIKSCGRIILDQVPQPIDGAYELLSWASKFFELALLTRGIVTLQRRKLKHADIAKFFNYIKIVPDKNTSILRHFIEKITQELGYVPAKIWVIGDSIPADINPGTEVGATCILYSYHHPSYFWRQEHRFPATGPFYRVDSLYEAKNILEKALKLQQTMISPCI